MFIIVWQNEVSGFDSYRKENHISETFHKEKACWIARVCLVAQLVKLFDTPWTVAHKVHSVHGDILSGRDMLE